MTNEEYIQLRHVVARTICYDVPVDDLEDVAQEAILATWLARPDNREAYAVRCAQNDAIDRLRMHKGRIDTRPLDPDLPWSKDPARVHSLVETADRLDRFFQEDWDQELIYCLLTTTYGWHLAGSYKGRNRVGLQPATGEMQQIADYLGVSYRAAKQRIARLRQRLRERNADRILVDALPAMG